MKQQPQDIGSQAWREVIHERWETEEVTPRLPGSLPRDKDSGLGAREGNAGRAGLSPSLDGGDGAGSLGKPRSRASRFPLMVKLLQFRFQSF